MEDDPNAGITTSRPFSTIPGRPPVREATRSAATNFRSPALQTEARQDAIVAVARARERAGLPATNWKGPEADIVFAITELLLRVQNQIGAEPQEGA